MKTIKKHPHILTILLPMISFYLQAQDSVYIHRTSGIEIVSMAEVDSVRIEPLKIELLNETVTDIDGIVYKTVKIGNQIWMAENLRTTHYRNGDAILTTTTADQNIVQESSPKYQWAANNNEANVATYGRLYTWHAATDSRGLAPTGWRLPTQEDFETLQLWLIRNGHNYDGTTSGEKVAKALASKTGWVAPENNSEGTPSFNPETNNTSSFNALPVGWREHEGVFNAFGEGISFFTSQTSTVNDSYAVNIFILNSQKNTLILQAYKRYGLSIRCIKK